MDIIKIRKVFGWCTLINMVLLLLSGLIFLFANDFIFNYYTSYMKISEENFHALWFIGLAFYKILVIIFNVVPYFALRIVYK